jgi:hypothetical protein
MQLKKFGTLVIAGGVVAFTCASSAETFRCWQWQTLAACEELRIPPHVSAATAPNIGFANVLYASPGFDERMR